MGIGHSDPKGGIVIDMRAIETGFRHTNPKCGIRYLVPENTNFLIVLLTLGENPTLEEL